ncbi:transposable element Tcb2 transposase [Trichonephila clavipes]|nr:transposable element Tcb2 transposase [Trichonephila clavipes]
MFTKGRIVGMLESSQSQTEVYRILNVNQSVISRLWQRFQRTGDVTQQPASGRPRVTTPRQDRYLVISARCVLPEHWVRCSQSPQEYEFRDKLFTGFSIMLVCMPEGQPFAFPSRLPKRALLNWSLKHQHWSAGEWANVIFSDETQFSLSSDFRPVTIWREHGTRFEPRNITKRHHFPSRGVMPYVRLLRGAVGPDFIFMDDNAPCRRAVLIDDFLETENIQRMSWPANSPDLNPI